MKFNRKLSSATTSMGDGTLLATLMGVTTVLVAIGIVLSRLWWGDIRFTNKVLDQKNQVNKTLEQNVAALPQLQENFRKLETEGPKPEKVFEALPIREEYAALAKELEAVAALAGAQLTATVKPLAAVLPPEQQPTQPTAIEMTLQSQVKGSYPALERFVTLIEATTRPVKVVKLNFNGSGQEVTLTVDMVTWWQPRTVLGDQKEVIEE